MLPTVIGLILFVLLVVLIGVWFIPTILELAINAAIMYLIGIRALKEINRGWLKEYGIGVIVGFIVLWMIGNIIPILWKFTTWLILAFLTAQLVRQFKKK